MLAAGLVVFLALVSPVACQYSDSNTSGFHLDSLTSGTLAIFCIFTLLFLLLGGWCFVALILARGHRSPYAFLFPTIILSLFANADSIALTVLINLPSYYVLPALVFPALDAINLFFNNWVMLFLFLALVAVLWNRESAIRVATEGKAGRHNPALIVVHTVLAVLILVLGTAGPAVYVNALIQYQTSESDFATADLQKQYQVYQKLNYAYNAFVVLTGFDIAISTILLWSACRTAHISDKITNIMLWVVVPLYALLNLLVMIFTIVFSDKGLPATTSSITTLEGANLADNLLVLLFTFAVIVVLLFMSVNRANWVVQGGAVQPDTEKPAQQYWSQSYNASGPYYGQPAGQPYGPQPYMPPAPLQQTPYQQPPQQQGPYQQAPFQQPTMHQAVSLATPIL